MLNVAAFEYDPNPWPSPKLTIPANRDDMVKAFAAFGPVVRGIMYVQRRISPSAPNLIYT